MFTGEEKDTKLFEKVTMPEEKSGLLNLVLPALNQLIEDNEFIGSDDIDTVQEDYILNSNTVASFVQERCEVSESEEDYTICRDLYMLMLIIVPKQVGLRKMITYSAQSLHYYILRRIESG